MPARRPTQAQLRERRSRIAAIVLGVVFLAVAALQGPKLLKMINGGSSSSAPPASTESPTTPGAASSSLSSSPTGALAGGALGPGQLNGFSLFNPVVVFKPIPKPASDSGATTTTAAKAPSTAAKPAAATPTTATPPPSAKQTTTSDKSATAPPAPPVTFTVPNGVPAALVKVNGKKQLFGAGAMFPQEAPLFKLAAIAKKGLKISVLGGTFVDGQHYLVLRQGNKVTLVNQSDGTKFVVVYVKKTFAPADELTSPTQTAASATTPAAPATTAPAPVPAGATAPATTAAG